MGDLHEQIKRLARHWDDQGAIDRPITVAATRPYVRQEFKAEKRGGPLLIGKHELVLVPRKKPDAPEYVQPDIECIDPA